MSDRVDTLPYQTYKKLKEKYPDKMILVQDADFQLKGVYMAYKNHQDFIEHQFAKIGIEVYRFRHNYNSLDTAHPELGLVFLANDSVLTPGLEVHALIGHNARYMLEADTKERI